MTLRKLFFMFWVYLFFTVGAQAESILQDTEGRNITLSDLQGKWVFINYWASWCHACVEEIPALNQFYEETKGDNVAVFAVNYDAVSIEKQRRLIKKLDIRYPSLKQDPAEILQLGDIRGVPVTFVINPQGELINALYGGQTVNGLKEIIAAN